MKYAVGLKLNERSGHVVIDAEDALIAALKAKHQQPDAAITYVRRQNRRGDARHPPHG
ncbi:MAG: hypothetical protein JNL45_10315 [Hyphomicrobium sp.]|jgi:hypothetical protein|nr:hypothetical protein [Hyphomicrobium sp.]